MHKAVLIAGVGAVFCLVVTVMWKLMPVPRREVDYLVIGATATMVSLGVLFVVLINTTHKGSDVFFKRRK